MNEDAIWRTIDDERSRLADLMADLSEAEWRTPSLCSDWTVREVAAHLTLSHTGALSATVSLVRAGGRFNRMIRDTAIRQARLSPEEYPKRLRAMVGSRRTAPFLTGLEPLIDVLCHTQDIVRPIGRVVPMPADAAVAAADHIWARSFPFRARGRLRGFALSATDASWRVGTGVQVEGPISALLLLVSGRPAGLADLTGPGVPRLAATFPPGAAAGASTGSRPET